MNWLTRWLTYFKSWISLKRLKVIPTSDLRRLQRSVSIRRSLERLQLFRLFVQS